MPLAEAITPSVASTRDPLLQPLRIKNLVLRNRVMSTSHAAGLEEGGMPKERYQLYHLEKAKGGIGLSMFGGSSNVAPDSPNIFRQLNVGTDEIVPWLQQFSARMHAEGAALMVQITHLGRRGEPYGDKWLPTIGPSAIRETLHRSFPKEMDEHDIRRVVKAYAAAARRCRDGGLDGVETLAGGHLIGQFLSPSTNRRTDRYGGSLENRCRFGLEVFEAIRREVGDDYVVGMRYVIDEGESGLPMDDAIKVAHLFERTGMLDFFNAIVGRMDTERALAVDNMPGMASPIAPWLRQVGAFKREVGLPVFHAARISDIATARHAIREGLLDMVAMTRAHIADPHIVRKIAAGEEERVRPCVGATHCQSPHRPHCIHNPSTGREGQLPHEITRSNRPGRKVVVVGGGPAGLEAARVAALRGHEVVLLEAGAKLGGQLLLSQRASWRRDVIGIVDWRAEEIRRLGVRVEVNRYAEVEDVLAEAPDAVVVATGGVPDIDWIPGAEHCGSVWDVIGGTTPFAGEVLVYDGTGRHPGPQAAEAAAQDGRKVQFVSIDAQIAQELTYAERIIWKKRIYELGVPTTFDHEIVKVERRGNRLIATFRNLASEQLSERTADQILVEHGTRPADDLYHGLRPHSANDGVTDIDALLAGAAQPLTWRPEAQMELHRVGDAVASRNVHTAVLDALRLCRAL
ncbi:NADH:flavin oxidoreductase/NADH oxidase [Methylobacterium sp. 4-46]|uniref:NADH:flavin oxidoreductase n=1 Tax=unclassified Methylobacterium TaxID=2615210 RepID=UPI000152E222|nr:MULTISPECIES: NADH:flavin oxidoreductase [Methylobacterium]ACA19840.1 NADH:flavin oxidoreductase/NADH oxidase [Methylobacterium sp. 4-46]WFT79024.1 NADH:flavin oxidoreductase [Methylobacterium nodulans]